ncbi:MAG: DUF934 domain-containing protein [Saccharospirillum sp.]|nr:DUF934 domain-containing protein [Saccharospirillum sp.]
MQALIKDGQRVFDDPWFISGLEDRGKPATQPLVPIAQFLDQHQEWTDSDAVIGVWLSEDDMPDALEPYLDRLDIIALHLPKFADGRAFSKARLLRQRFGFQGEIRLTGDFLPDQAAYYARCGVNAFACRTEEEADIAVALLAPFSVHYQSDAHQATLFERRHEAR